MYMMVESKIVDPLEVGGHVLAGYLNLMDLTDDEFDALKMCVAGRFAQVRFGDDYNLVFPCEVLSIVPWFSLLNHEVKPFSLCIGKIYLD